MITPRVAHGEGSGRGLPKHDWRRWYFAQWRHLSNSTRATFACIMHAESRGHYAEGPNYEGASGLFQFVPSTWVEFAHKIGIYTKQAYLSSRAKQVAVAVSVWWAERFLPWRGDPCVG